jgi:DNA-binding MarR family transcriptional regulator
MAKPRVTPKKPQEPALPYDVENFVGKEGVGALITRSKTQLWDAADRALAPYNITLSQWIVLEHLYRDPATTPADICKEIGYDPGAMTRLLDRLEANSFIRRTRHPSDRRSVKLELTAAGRSLHPKLLKVMVREMNFCLDGFTVAEARLLESLLQRVLLNARNRVAQLREEA